MNKRLIATCIVIALAFHGGGLYLLHKMRRHTPQIVSKKLSPEGLGKETPTEQWVTELFDTVKSPLRPIKEELRELAPEFVPAFEVTFSPPQKEEEDPFLTFPSLSCDLPDLGTGFSLDSKTLALRGDHKQEGDELLTSNDFSYLEKEGKECVAESDHFDVHVELLPRRLHPGYLFKATLVPKQQIAFKRIRENYFFLIDRSNSIIRGRYFYNKKAVSEVLSFLKPGDHFNILIFDNHVMRLARKALPWNEENVKLARLFLEEQGHGGYFATTDLYSSLGKIIPQDVAAEEINTAILLSDGDTYLPIDKQRQLIGGWSTYNQGKVSLHCLASGGGNNLPLLEVLSTFNKGELIYVSKHDQVIDRLKQLVLSLQNPIGKEIVATAVTATDEMAVYLQPRGNRLPDLYKNRPFTVFGYTNRLDDFTLFVQGSYYDRKFDIKKRISFEGAKRGTLFLEREWAQLAATEHYERFFQDGKKAHLEAASELLAPLNVTVPFLQ